MRHGGVQVTGWDQTVLDEPVGTFVIRHGAVTGDAADVEGRPVSPGVMVPGSRAGELAGITGSATSRHDETGTVFTLDDEVG